MKLKDAIRTLLFKKKKYLHNQLYTKWGEQLDPKHVMEEYPRPQLRRDNFTILNGYWKYSITKELTKPNIFDGEILVPFSPESILSGVDKQLMPDQFLWYERNLHINKINDRNRCILHFCAVDQFCEIWLNNKKVAEHMGGFLPFSIDITDTIIVGENLITLKVVDYSETSYHSRGKQQLKRGGIFYTAQSGIWQTVWMEWVPKRYITSIKIMPLVDKSSVKVEISMNDIISDKESNEEFNIDILANQQVIQSIKSNQPIITIHINDVEYWSPEHPFLYDMVITTLGDIITPGDKVESYFAMRKYEIKKDSEGIPRIFLNNAPYFQNGVLDQGYWPDGLYTAPSDEAMIFDIQKAKEMGFNMLRKHIKIEPLRWYYHCDRLGVIVWQDMVNGGDKYNMILHGYLPTIFIKLQNSLKDNYYDIFSRKDENGRKEWSAECKSTVEHLYNCPSIAVWVPFNEGWGQFDAAKAVKLIREIDKTRLIDHASGWYDQKDGDFKSIHNYFHKLDVVTEKRAVVLSEFGGYACYIPNHTYSKQIFGYRIYKSKKELNDAYQKLYREEIRLLIKKGLSAAVYTQLIDIEDEINGLFTYDRKVCKVAKVEVGK